MIAPAHQAAPRVGGVPAPSSDPLGLRDIASFCENSLTVSTVCTPHGNAKCDQNQVELGAAMARTATAEWQKAEPQRAAS